MTILDTQLNARSADFLANAAAMRALVDDLRAQLDKVAQGGGEAARAKHTARGKLLPRERVQMLLDPGTPFLELAPLAALNIYDNAAPGAGLIAGIGRVSGIDCMIVCNDATVKGHLLPAHRQEAPACARSGAAEPSALHLPGGLGRRQPA